MRFVVAVVSALVEAWGEVRVQRTRVILSLVGVMAAVAAMSTVMALGDLTVQSTQEMMDAGEGRPVTLRIDVSRAGEGDGAPVGGGGVAVDLLGNEVPLDPSTVADTEAAGASPDSEDARRDDSTFTVSPVSRAMITVADRFRIPYWSRVETGDLALAELEEARNTGIFRGRPALFREWTMPSVHVQAVDPAYATIYRTEVVAGRWLTAGDVNQRVVPVVINSVTWDMLGRADFVSDPLVLHDSADDARAFRVVGVVKAFSAWEAMTMYVPFDGWAMSKPASGEPGNASMIVWVGEDQADEARDVLPRTLSAALGEGWSASVSGGERFDAGRDQLAMFRVVIMGIGGIVILLGALGLLNVALVTVKQRIREIGIRRALGASARRVFFAVFMESVVATLVAGVLGVGIAIVIVRFLPLETMGIFLQERPAFPMPAALAGVGIASTVGALCGIIPAVAAVRVRPIDAIRY